MSGLKRTDDKLIEYIPDPRTLKELQIYANQACLQIKVIRIIRDLIKRNHIELARKIEAKYSHLLPNSDTIAGFQLLAHYLNEKKS